MEERIERKMMKNWTKGTLRKLFQSFGGSTVKFNPATGSWSIEFDLSFEVPQGLENVEKGFNEDVKRDGVISFMKEQSEQVHQIIQKTFDAIVLSDASVRVSYAAPLPPVFNVTRRDGKWRWLTEEEKATWSEASEFMKKTIEIDDKLVSEGIYELVEDADTDYEMEAFTLRKYTSLRGFFTYEVSHERLKEIWSMHQGTAKTA